MKNDIENFEKRRGDKGTPFKKNLVKSDVSPYEERLKEFKGDSSNVIRDEPLWLLKKDFEEMKDLSHMERVKMCKKLFNELREDYNIRVANTDFVIGDNKRGKPSIYVITEKIEGTDINKLYDIYNNCDTEEFIKELDDLYYNLACYICDKYKSEEYYLNDVFANRQYMFGKSKEDKEDHIYLVDTDALVSDGVKETLPYEAYVLSREILKMENALNETNEVRFEKVRNKLEEFFNSIPKEDIKKDERTLMWIRYTKRNLNLQINLRTMLK